MKYVYLTSAEFIRNLTNISSNIQDKFLQSAMRESQDVGLQGVLGSKLLSKLQELVAKGEIKSEGNEKYNELVKECQYYLAYETISNLCMISGVKIDNMGPNQTTDEHIQSLSLNDIMKVKDYYTNKSDFYKDRLQKYLVQNHSDYPELHDCEIGDMHSNLYSAATTGIWLGGVRGKRKSY